MEPDKSLEREDIEPWIVDSLIEMKLIRDASEVRQVQVRDIPFAYPVPTADRDATVSVIHRWLEDGRDLLGGSIRSVGLYQLGRSHPTEECCWVRNSWPFEPFSRAPSGRLRRCQKDVRNAQTSESRSGKR